MALDWPPWTLFYHLRRTTYLVVLLGLVVTASAAELPEGVRRIKVLNYADCFELLNAETRVKLCHQAGERGLDYSFQGTNTLPRPDETKWGQSRRAAPAVQR